MLHEIDRRPRRPGTRQQVAGMRQHALGLMADLVRAEHRLLDVDHQEGGLARHLSPTRHFPVFERTARPAAIAMATPTPMPIAMFSLVTPTTAPTAIPIATLMAVFVVITSHHPYSAAFFGASGFQRSTGWRAASVSSRRRRGVW